MKWTWATLLLTACGGTIELGVDRGDSGVILPPPPSDAGVVMMGRDAGPMSTPDAGACTPRQRPAVPAAWPFPMTKQAYLTHFFNVLPGTASSCGTAGACHGTGGVPPFIPQTTTQLDVQADLTNAISQLWLRSRPPGAGVTPILRSKHDPAAIPPTAPAFTAPQMAAIDMFLSRAHDCAWKTAPAPLPGECAAPNVAYCDQQ